MNRSLNTAVTKTAQRILFVCVLATIVSIMWTAGVCANPAHAYADETTGNQALTTGSQTATTEKLKATKGTWEKWSSGWYFKKKNGTYATGFIRPNKETDLYYLDSKGLMKTGWFKVKGSWYFANKSGQLQKGWKTYRGGKYYLDPADKYYVMKTGFFTPQGEKNTYYAGKDGKIVTNTWVKSGDKMYLVNSKGHLKQIKGVSYKDKKVVATKGGKAVSGWFKKGGYKFYSKPGTKGVLVKGWQKIKGSWYYFDKNHAMATGWRNVNGAQYYLSPKNGKMYKGGWKTIGKTQYKFTKSGAMVGAWVNVPCYMQNPELPAGCESVALTNALRFYGFSLSKTTIADAYLPQSNTNFVTAFTGNPYSQNGGQTCAPGIVLAANKYLKSEGSKLRAHELTGTTFAKLCAKQLDKGRPVIIWTAIGNSNIGAPYAQASYNGRTYTAATNSHTVVLAGYDNEEGAVWLSDSISGKVKLSYNQVKDVYKKRGMQAVVLY